MFIFLYRFFAWPLLRVVFEIAGLFVPKIRRGLELRRPHGGRAPWIKALPIEPPTLWIHAASGEFEYAKPVITLLKAERPDIRIVVTYFSPTYADAIRRFRGVDWVVPLPWDTPRALGEFLRSFHPFALVVARTDVWPEMAHAAREHGLSTLLFSATLTENSGRARGLGRWVSRASLGLLDAIFGVTDADVEAFRSLTAQSNSSSSTKLTSPRIERAGDTRYDQVLARLKTPKAIKQFGFDLFVCGSTWPEDEAVLIPALSKTPARGAIVPHEPTREHLEALESELLKAGLTPVRYSDPNAESRFSQPKTCLLVDQTGLLAELYLQAESAFVGGSFRKTVHSVMEPLAAGCRTLVGPKHLNNREAVEFRGLTTSSGLEFVACVTTPEELQREIQKTHEAHLPEMKDEIKAAVFARTGGSRKVVDWIYAELANH